MKLSGIFYRLIFSLFILTATGFFSAQTAFSQAEKLGTVSYAPPKGWTKTPKENIVVFSEVNQSTGGFCVITLYGATSSAGNPQADFTREWNNLVVKQWGGEANPKTESEADDGWTAVAAGGAVSIQGNKALALLTVFSGFGQTVSVLAVLNDNSYLDQITAFVSKLEIDKTAAATNAAPATNAAAIQNNQSGKFGLMVYTAPAGWTEEIFQDGVVFKPSDLPTGENLAIQIMPPLNASGVLEQALQQSYDEAAKMYKATKMNDVNGGNYSKTEAGKSFMGWEYIRGKGSIQIDNGTAYKTELGLELFVVKVNNRFERIAIIESRTNCNLSRYYASDRISYRAGIEDFLFSLKFADADYAGLTSGSTKGNGIVGVWQGISLSVGQQSTGQPLGVGYKVYSPIFLTNGQAYFGPKFPASGLEGLNTRIPAELYRRDWGTYTFSNGRGVLKMLYGDIPLRMEGNTLVITANRTDHKFYKLNSVDGARFNGTYAIGNVNGKIPAVAFSSDGRFADRGALKVLYHEYIDCINPALAEGSGTYEVKDYSIIFNYSDGRKIKIAFLGNGFDVSNRSPASLQLSSNDDKLTKQ